jgi:hypothetical protein
LKLTPIKLSRQNLSLLLSVALAGGLAIAYNSELSTNKELSTRVTAAEALSAASTAKIATLTTENAEFTEKFKAAEGVFAEKEQELSYVKAALQNCGGKKRVK